LGNRRIILMVGLGIICGNDRSLAAPGENEETSEPETQKMFHRKKIYRDQYITTFSFPYKSED